MKEKVCERARERAGSTEWKLGSYGDLKRMFGGAK